MTRRTRDQPACDEARDDADELKFQGAGGANRGSDSVFCSLLNLSLSATCCSRNRHVPCSSRGFIWSGQCPRR